MFFYISFLRPPPTRASLSAPILITPQISNDLRTEPFWGVQDLFYSWWLEPLNTSPSTRPGAPAPSAKAPIFTPSIKLTTWRQSNAYKEIPVPLPKGVREGQHWRLLLTAADQLPQSGQHPAMIELDKEALGYQPFPVLSVAILFTAKASGGKGGQKQEQIERVYRFPVARPRPCALKEGSDVGSDVAAHIAVSAEGPVGGTVALRIREQTSFDLDKKIWDSGIGLSSWLVRLMNGRIPASSPGSEGGVYLKRLEEILLSSSGQKILELGAGTGIVALVLSILRCSVLRDDGSPDERDRICTTDLESAMPLLEHNISSNRHLFSSLPSTMVSLEAGVLDWDQSVSNQLGDEYLREGFDLVVMADVTYNTASFPSLVQTLKDVIQLNEAKKPCILLGYKERDEAERSLWQMTESIGIKFVQVGKVPGAGGVPIEIWIG